MSARRPIVQPSVLLGLCVLLGVSGCLAFEESFDGDPERPSQDLLPANFDFSVTHRTHPRDHEPDFPSYPADHGDDCAGPVTSTPDRGGRF